MAFTAHQPCFYPVFDCREGSGRDLSWCEACMHHCFACLHARMRLHDAHSWHSRHSLGNVRQLRHAAATCAFTECKIVYPSICMHQTHVLVLLLQVHMGFLVEALRACVWCATCREDPSEAPAHCTAPRLLASSQCGSSHR